MFRVFLVILILSFSVKADAQLKSGEFDPETKKLKDVSVDKILTKEEASQLRAGIKGSVNWELKLKKNDYNGHYDRGTVEYDEDDEVRNFCFHKVSIPDNTTVRNKNFSQKNPNTEAIAGKNLTFINCNLTNVLIDPTWDVSKSKTGNVRTRTITEGEEDYEVREIEESTDVWVEVDRNLIVSE